MSEHTRCIEPEASGASLSEKQAQTSQPAASPEIGQQAAGQRGQAQKYRCIVADPPWAENGGGKCKRGADRHYKTMKLPDIVRAMLKAPCWRPAEDCHLWLWYTDNFLPHALCLVDQLGFRYVRTMQWVKAEPERISGVSTDELMPQWWRLQPFGLGQYLRGQHEGCILAVRGKGRDLVQHRDVRSVVMAPKNTHSTKPGAAYEAIERVSPEPRLEMFARAQRAGWDVWGNEVAS